MSAMLTEDLKLKILNHVFTKANSRDGQIYVSLHAYLIGEKITSDFTQEVCDWLSTNKGIKSSKVAGRGFIDVVVQERFLKVQ